MNKFKKNFTEFFGLDSYDDHNENTENDDYEDEVSSVDSVVSDDLAERSIYESEIDSVPPYFDETIQNTHTSIKSEPVNEKKVVAMNSYQPPLERNKRVENKRLSKKVSVFEPSNYIECRTIAQALFRKEVVILTFASMEEYQARRVVDFLTGTVYALDGDIQRIGEEIFLCTPENVEVTSTIAQSLVKTHLGGY
ncbi:cell division protein SepF [Vagococcus vulneris]|uniref:Cell division protein SepF n=1 Tax=Vagococcus vulneris TaxID=1977869 RepID=A0A429ZW90_9ENTE|nr:cell division protein SepF [Vagococcus vulneris]RST98033.1 hypothetical protein CBF37_09015 [Vagococcus vulneris]